MSYKCHYCGYVASRVTNYCVKCGKPRAGEFVVIRKDRFKELEKNQKEPSFINKKIKQIVNSEHFFVVPVVLFIIMIVFLLVGVFIDLCTELPSIYALVPLGISSFIMIVGLFIIFFMIIKYNLSN
jgi:uncharacterized membrane protein